MDNLTKVRDVSTRYDISARALKYYEDAGLLTSTRTNDYAYRMYDETAVMRLEQILILRKLNISIKDIQRIFDTTGSEIVLDILNGKVANIDEEVALLHDLKEIVLDFIRQINQSDFNRDADVKKLYEKAKEIESHIVNVEYEGNPATVNRLLEVTDKLDDKRLTTPVVIRTYRQEFKATRFIGKKFTSGAEAWNEENKNHFTQSLQEQLNINFKELNEDGDALIGFMAIKDGNFEYWLGFFTPENTLVPQGYEYEDFPAANVGVGWVYGKEDEIYGVERMVVAKLNEEGFEFIPGAPPLWFERYSPLRNKVDTKGYAIIDIGIIGLK